MTTQDPSKQCTQYYLKAQTWKSKEYFITGMHYLHIVAQPGRYHKVDVHTYNLPTHSCKMNLTVERVKAKAKAKPDKKSHESTGTAVTLQGMACCQYRVGRRGDSKYGVQSGNQLALLSRN